MLKHTDDDGDLSVFASGDQILFACAKGHFWVVEASEAGTTAEEHQADGPPARAALLAESFGPHARAALGIRAPD